MARTMPATVITAQDPISGKTGRPLAGERGRPWRARGRQRVIEVIEVHFRLSAARSRSLT